jgi:hypothetical protein
MEGKKVHCVPVTPGMGMGMGGGGGGASDWSMNEDEEMVDDLM